MTPDPPHPFDTPAQRISPPDPPTRREPSWAEVCEAAVSLMLSRMRGESVHPDLRHTTDAMVDAAHEQLKRFLGRYVLPYFPQGLSISHQPTEAMRYPVCTCGGRLPVASFEHLADAYRFIADHADPLGLHELLLDLRQEMERMDTEDWPGQE